MVDFARKTEAEIKKVHEMTKGFVQIHSDAQAKAEQENRQFIKRMETQFSQQVQQTLSGIERDTE